MFRLASLSSLSLALPFVLAYFYPYKYAEVIQYGAFFTVVFEILTFVSTGTVSLDQKTPLFMKHNLFLIIAMASFIPLFFSRSFIWFSLFFFANSFVKIYLQKFQPNNRNQFIHYSLAILISTTPFLFPTFITTLFPIPTEFTVTRTYIGLYMVILYYLVLALFNLINWPNLKEI